MNAKEKAKELIWKYLPKINGWESDEKTDLAKELALITVDEILNNNCGANTDGQQAYEEEIYCDEYFWNDVKSELQNI
jgi:hypothetical protein